MDVLFMLIHTELPTLPSQPSTTIAVIFVIPGGRLVLDVIPSKDATKAPCSISPLLHTTYTRRFSECVCHVRGFYVLEVLPCTFGQFLVQLVVSSHCLVLTQRRQERTAAVTIDSTLASKHTTIT